MTMKEVERLALMITVKNVTNPMCSQTKKRKWVLGLTFGNQFRELLLSSARFSKEIPLLSRVWGFGAKTEQGWRAFWS